MNRVKFPLPQPIPDTPIRGIRFIKIEFQSAALQRLARAARRKAGSKWAVIKPKRASRGILWNGKPYYWTVKGYYRCGLHTDRRPLQVHIWEKQNRRPMPRGQEIFFRNRDRHDFRKSNLEMLSKPEMHRRIAQIGESVTMPYEFTSAIRGKFALKVSRERTSLLLERFNKQESNEHSNIIASVHERRTNITRSA